MKIHCMVDFETLSTMPNAAVLSLGAVAFTAEGVVSEFYVNIDSDDCIDKGLHVSLETVTWWSKQSQEAQDQLQIDKLDLLTAMTMFSKWVRFNDCSTVWGNGADFDNPILKNCYAVLEADPPFKPYAGRCYRTIKNMPKAPKMGARTGTHHNALDDARNQALHLIEINKLVEVFE